MIEPTEMWDSLSHKRNLISLKRRNAVCLVGLAFSV